jgi:hypothetical protein
MIGSLSSKRSPKTTFAKGKVAGECSSPATFVSSTTYIFRIAIWMGVTCHFFEIYIWSVLRNMAGKGAVPAIDIVNPDLGNEVC